MALLLLPAATAASFIRRPTADTNSFQEHELGSGRDLYDLALVRVVLITLLAGLVDDDDDDDDGEVAGICCCDGDGSNIA